MGIRTKDYLSYWPKPSKELLKYYRNELPIIYFDALSEKDEVIANRTRSQTKRRNAKE